MGEADFDKRRFAHVGTDIWRLAIKVTTVVVRAFMDVDKHMDKQIKFD
jgi:hypothetical protein